MQMTSRRIRRLSLLFAIVLLCAAASLPRGASAQALEFAATFSTSPRLASDLERLDGFAAAAKWNAWAPLLQQLLDDERRQVIERDSGFLIGLRRALYERLKAAPAAGRAAYLKHAEAPAAQAYQAAAGQSDTSDMRSVLARYRETRMGPKALRWLADRALDAGRAGEAAVAYERLAETSAATPEVLLRGAVAASQADRPALATRLIQRVRSDFAAHPVRLAGEKITGKAAADQVAAGLKSTGPAAEPLQAFHRHAAVPARPSSPVSGELRRIWEYRLPMSRSVSISVFTGPGFRASPSYRFLFLGFPTVQGDQLWVQGPRSFAALDRSSGQPLWDYQHFFLTEDEMPDDNVNSRKGGIYYSSDRPVQGVPAVEGHLVAGRFPMAASEPTGQRWPADMAVGLFDARGGSLRWKRVAGGSPPGIFYNIPALRQNVVYSGIATHRGGITEYRAVALDAGSGEPMWECYLGGGTDPQGAVDGSPPLVHEGLVWTETSMYTLAGLDLLTGDPWLIYRYDPPAAVVTRYGGRIYVRNHPVTLLTAYGDRLIYVPRWSADMLALNLKSEKPAWSVLKPADPQSRPVLTAADEERAYLVGSDIHAASLADGKPVWNWRPPEGADLPSIPALVGDHLYVPCGKQVFVLEKKTGRQAAELHIGGPDAETTDMGVMTGAPEALYFQTAEKLIAFALP